MTIAEIIITDINWSAWAAWIGLFFMVAGSYVHVLIKIATLNERVSAVEISRKENRDEHVLMFNKLDEVKDTTSKKIDEIKNIIIDNLSKNGKS